MVDPTIAITIASASFAFCAPAATIGAKVEGYSHMHCPYCRADNDRVLDSRSIEDGRAIRRRRFCNQCRKRFTTYERVETFTLQVVKKDQAREPFQREKIERGVERACWKRPVSTEAIRQLAASVETELQTDYETEVASDIIGRLVMEGLAKIDQVAYVRFASVYREFKDVADFVAELEPMFKPVKTFPGPVSQ